MRFNEIDNLIQELIKDRYEIDNNNEICNELLYMADEDIRNKHILRIKRKNIVNKYRKTLVIVEINSSNEDDIKREFRLTMKWIALIRENLIGFENCDLYLFISFGDNIGVDECLRIEATEQFCRKYVLFPNESINDYLSRTFLQCINLGYEEIDGENPIERAFNNTHKTFEWFNKEIQDSWKESFKKYTGSDLAESLIREDITHDTY